jgi:peptidoglycan/xylan/chitin deacetylase (PgdA/CDA1 family)
MATCSSANRVKLILNLTELLKQFPEDRIELLLNSLGTGPQSFGDERSSMLSWEEAVEMKGSGIAFGSHAKSHGILTLMTVAEVARESIESKDIIQKRLGATVNFFAYPNGDFNESVSKIVKSSGYLAAFTCIPGFNHIAENNFDLKRSNMREDSSDFMGRFSPLFFAVELSGVRLLIKQMLCKGKKN